MRNLKRVLSLALALVMMLGMMIIGANAASADFADADEITYTEAVGVMAAIGVLEGDGTNFNPTDILTREQAAAIICRMLVGPETAKKLGATQVFDDVPADWWSAPVVAYCANLGIIAGYGDGTFGRADELTGVAFAKMLLVALGNDPVERGYVGSNWATSVAVDAIKAGLDLDGVALAAPLTREQASQMAFTALTYSPDGGMTYVVNGLSFDNLKDAALYGSLLTPAQTPVATPTIEGSLAQTVFNLDSATDVVEDNGATVAGQKYTTIGGTKYAVETGLDMIGHNVTVYYKTASGVPAAGYTTYLVVDNTTEVAVAGTETADQLKAALAAVGVTTNLTASTVYTYTNGVKSASANNAAITLGTTDGATFGASTILVANKAIIGVVAPTTYTANKVTAIGTTAGSETITLNGVGPLNNNATSDVVNEYAGIAEDDYVLVTQCGAVYNLAKVQTVEGKITKIANSAKYTVNGVDYAASSISDNSGISDDAANFTDTFKLYLDAEGKYFAIKKVTDDSTPEASDLVYVVTSYSIDAKNAYGVTTTYYYAQFIDLDGAEGSILIGVDSTGANSVTPGFATYALSSTPAAAKLGIQTISAAPTAYNATTAPVIADTLNSETAVTVNTGSLSVTTNTKAYVNSATKYIFVNGSKDTLETEVVVGGINSTIATGAKMLLSKDADGNYIVKAIIAGNTYTNAGVTASDYLYITAQTSPAQTAAGYEFTVYNAATGDKSTVTATNASVSTAGFYSYSVADGVYTFGSKATAVTSGNGVYEDQAYSGKYGTKISSTNLTDIEAANAVVIDLRSASTITTDGVAAITSIDAMHAAKTASTPKTANFTALVNANSVVIIFITDLT